MGLSGSCREPARSVLTAAPIRPMGRAFAAGWAGDAQSGATRSTPKWVSDR